jgi:hypothetical protein
VREHGARQDGLPGWGEWSPEPKQECLGRLSAQRVAAPTT